MAADGVVGVKYDEENIFAKILEGKIPAFKVYESKSCIAILDAFPMAEYHTLVIPKARGATCLLDMKMHEAGDVLLDVQRVARAVKKATGCDGINILQNNGEAAGQTVFHPHFHILPRFKDDKTLSLPASRGSMISPEEAKPVSDKIKEALKPPPKALKKPKFGKVAGVKPNASGLNLRVKVVEEPKQIDNGGKIFHEVRVGDASASVILSLYPEQLGVCKKDSTVTLQNARAIMVKGHIRLGVDKWGKISESDEKVDEVNTTKDMSELEYELVKGSR